MLGYQLLKKVLSCARKNVLNAQAAPGRRLKTLMDVVGFGEFNRSLERDLALFFHLRFVAYKIYCDVLRSVLLYFL